MKRRPRLPRAFTLIEVAAVLTITAAGASVIAVPLGFGQPGNARAAARQIKDSSQLRGIVQAMMIWGSNNNEAYPLPSALDKASATVKGENETKDTTANIFSIMIFNGLIPVDLTVSPDEQNPAITVMKRYSFNQPKAAVKPDLALWDPAFSADFTNHKKGNVSYANLQPSGKRLERWRNTPKGEDVVLANRGPEIKSVVYDGDKSATVQLANPKSHTLRIHGDGASWSGHAAFNDGHVDFAKAKLADGAKLTADSTPSYRTADGPKHLDVWCYDEPDDQDATNNFLGIFVTAGSKPSDFKAIWD